MNSRINDEKLTNQYPNAIVINIGYGLDDGKIKWYDIGLAEMISLRKNFYQDNKRRKMIVANFNKGYLVAELIKQSIMNEKKHDMVKYTKATFDWGGRDSAIEYTHLDSRLQLVSEESFST